MVEVPPNHKAKPTRNDKKGNNQIDQSVGLKMLETASSEIVKTSITKGRDSEKQAIEYPVRKPIAWDEVNHQKQSTDTLDNQSDSIDGKEIAL